ncbi:hypothetical protein ACQ86G_21435 [Roseateles chitinivorans]|uniref:hypothetical protein n=1 Tax=Roseateles chitinivorans TaxID=2917965 RepID=UPI003D67F8BC
MLKTVDLIDMAKKRHGDVTDYRIGKLLGIDPSKISTYRHTASKPGNPIAMRLGELAGVDPLEAVALVNLERATAPEEREVWEAILERLSHAKKGRKAS